MTSQQILLLVGASIPTLISAVVVWVLTDRDFRRTSKSIEFRIIGLVTGIMGWVIAQPVLPEGLPQQGVAGGFCCLFLAQLAPILWDRLLDGEGPVEGLAGYLLPLVGIGMVLGSLLMS